MAIDCECKGPGVPVNHGRWTTQRVRRVGLDVVLRVQTLLLWLFRIGYKKKKFGGT